MQSPLDHQRPAEQLEALIPGEHPLARSLRLANLRLGRFARTKERQILYSAMVIFVVIFTLIGAWKLWSFSYNGLDLAIYRQVAENSIHGKWFAFTIHPHSYLGDHMELLFLALLPFLCTLPTTNYLGFSSSQRISAGGYTVSSDRRTVCW